MQHTLICQFNIRLVSVYIVRNERNKQALDIHKASNIQDSYAIPKLAACYLREPAY